MGKIQRFEDLEIWQKSMEICVDAYRLSSTGKLSKDYGLKDQLTRAAVSISNNIAEGFEYDNNKDFVKYLRYAKGSTGEVRNILQLLLRIDFITQAEYNLIYDKLITLSKQIYGFIKYLKTYNESKK